MASAKNYDPADFTKLYIAGQFVTAKSGKSYSLPNPQNNQEVVHAVPIASAEYVEDAVIAAEAAYAGEWQNFSGM